jgi:glycosyltransferase involved in cell wall biosynthesis
VSQTCIAGRVIFVYAGNIGVAQGMHTFLSLIESLKNNSEIGFLIVGRGSEAEMIKQAVHHQDLHNAVVFDEISPFEIPGLFEQCHVGLMFLDRRHQTHNIPGKFVTYLQSGLPVLAIVNPGNDLLKLVPEHNIGVAYEGDDLHLLKQKVLALASQVREDKQMADRCKALANSLFESKTIAHQILSTFS